MQLIDIAALIVRGCCLMAVIAFASGVWALWVGRSQWHQSNREVFTGKRSAVMYAGVQFSTAWSLWHAFMLWQWADKLSNSVPTLFNIQTSMAWMILHYGFSLAFIAYHFIVVADIRKRDYLWGNDGRA